MAATNRWLTALQSLKGITENLRTMLATNNIKVYNSDTLSDLIGKVPSMSPIVIDGSKRKKWEPDPLWVFPDPNGSNQAKNIRQIYDEDSLADSYTYRGIYMVRGDYDSLDLKQCMGSTTNKTTFILSDGTRYDDITASSLIHNWDKSKDVIDSSNVPMRYIRIYSDASYSYLPSFYCTVVWCVHNLATSVGTYGSQQCSNISNKHTSMYYNYNIQCVELGSKVTSINGYSSGYFPLGRPYKLVIDGNLTSLSYGFSSYEWGMHELEANNLTSPNIYNQGFYSYFLDEINIPDSMSTLTSCTLTLNYVPNIKSLKGLSKLDKVTSFSLSYLYNHDATIEELPPNLTSCTMQYCYGLESLSLPSTIQTLNLTGLYRLKSIVIPTAATNVTLSNLGIESLHIPSTVTKITCNYLSNLKYISVDYGFNINGLDLTMSTCLSKDCIVSLLENLADRTTTGARTLTLGSVNLAKLSAEEKLIATNKNWTLA